MNPIILQNTSSDTSIVNNNLNIKYEKHTNISYKNVVCIKPWGYEYLIYESNMIGIWYLNINKNNGTSLHCHFNKDTFIIVLYGCAKVTLIDNSVLYLNSMESMYIPKYKFHGIASFSDTTVIIEIEIFSNNVSFSDKNDLLRISDIYKRKSVGYESSVTLERVNLTNYNYFYLNPNTCINLYDISIKLNAISSIDDLLKLDANTYNILLNGSIFDTMKFIKEGSLLTINKNMIVDDTVLILSLNKNGLKDDTKVIYDIEHLKLVTRKLHCENKKIILTSGCFDILHVGHIETLKRAKALGNILIVCLSSDEQIKYLKGNTRPINNLKDRLSVFKTISHVDYVIPYNEEYLDSEGTLGEIIKIINPEYWVKGSDYTVEQILTKHPYIRNIKILDLIDNKSTTAIIKKLQSEV